MTLGSVARRSFETLLTSVCCLLNVTIYLGPPCMTLCCCFHAYNSRVRTFQLSLNLSRFLTLQNQWKRYPLVTQQRIRPEEASLIHLSKRERVAIHSRR